jgi:hypothetical protein
VLHRIVAISEGPNGEPLFTTQGDSNASSDAEPAALAGQGDKMVYSVPYAGYILDFAGSLVGRLTLIGLPLAYFAVAYARNVRQTNAPARAPLALAVMPHVAAEPRPLAAAEPSLQLELLEVRPQAAPEPSLQIELPAKAAAAEHPVTTEPPQPVQPASEPAVAGLSDLRARAAERLARFQTNEMVETVTAAGRAGPFANVELPAAIEPDGPVPQVTKLPPIEAPPALIDLPVFLLRQLDQITDIEQRPAKPALAAAGLAAAYQEADARQERSAA